MIPQAVLWIPYFLSLVHAAPIEKVEVDLTYTFDQTTLNWPEVKPFNSIVVLNASMPQGFWLQSDEFTTSTHAGTHMDAPAHFSKGGATIDQIPLSKLVAPAAVVDISTRAALNPDEAVTVEDLLKWEDITGQSLNGTILLLRTGWGRKWGDKVAYTGTGDNDVTKLRFPGLAGEAAHWLVSNRSINGIGIDTLSFDVGATRDFVAHQVLLGHGLFGLENVANLEQLPIYGATLYVMPMKIGEASGAPTRIFSTYPKVLFQPPSE